jgi:hypothetical protein
MTRDIDVVVALQPQDTDRFIALFTDEFYCDPDAVVAAVRERGLFNAIHLEHVVKVDFVVRKDTPYRRAEFGRRRSVQVDEATILVVAPEDLLLSKLVWAKESGSEVQLRDARNLLDSVGSLDWAYVSRWARDLTVGDLLKEVRS